MICEQQLNNAACYYSTADSAQLTAAFGLRFLYTNESTSRVIKGSIHVSVHRVQNELMTKQLR